MNENTAERAMRSGGVCHTNYPFIGSQIGGKAATIVDTLIETARLNAINPQTWPADTLARIPAYKLKRVDDLLPWKTG